MKNQKGITLIALIITIIVMMILVGVSVSTALQTGLFKTAQGAAKNTEAEKVKEVGLSDGKVEINGVGTKDIEDYVAGITGKKDEEMKEEGYTHKIAITVNGKSYEYHIKENVTKGSDLASKYDEFSEENEKIMFLEEYELISKSIYWTTYDAEPPYNYSVDYNFLTLCGDDDYVLESKNYSSNNRRGLAIGEVGACSTLNETPYNSDENFNASDENGPWTEYFDECPFIDFTITKL